MSKGKTSPEGDIKVILTNLGFGESARWHCDRLWLANWGTQQILAVDQASNSEIAARVPTTLPFCFDWLPDGRLLVVSGPEALVLRMEFDGSFTTHIDLRTPSASVWNEIVVDGRGNIYVNGNGIVLITPDGTSQQVAENLAFPNGMAIRRDNSTLVVAESHGNRLTAFDIEADGSLRNRRVWADLGGGVPDGICIDAEDAIWYADVPNKQCVRIREGGEVLQRVELDRGCFSCALGGDDRKTLYMLAAEWLGFPRIGEALQARTGQVLAIEASVPGAGWP